jgi:hypothetical protein
MEGELMVDGRREGERGEGGSYVKGVEHNADPPVAWLVEVGHRF